MLSRKSSNLTEDTKDWMDANMTKPKWLTSWQVELELSARAPFKLDKASQPDEAPTNYITEAHKFLMNEAIRRDLSPVEVQVLEQRYAEVEKQMWRHANDERTFGAAICQALGMTLGSHGMHVALITESMMVAEQVLIDKAQQRKEKEVRDRDAWVKERVDNFAATWDGHSVQTSYNSYMGEDRAIRADPISEMYGKDITAKMQGVTPKAVAKPRTHAREHVAAARAVATPPQHSRFTHAAGAHHITNSAPTTSQTPEPNATHESGNSNSSSPLREDTETQFKPEVSESPDATFVSPNPDHAFSESPETYMFDRNSRGRNSQSPNYYPTSPSPFGTQQWYAPDVVFGPETIIASPAEVDVEDVDDEGQPHAALPHSDSPVPKKMFLVYGSKPTRPQREEPEPRVADRPVSRIEDCGPVGIGLGQPSTPVGYDSPVSKKQFKVYALHPSRPRRDEHMTTTSPAADPVDLAAVMMSLITVRKCT